MFKRKPRKKRKPRLFKRKGFWIFLCFCAAIAAAGLFWLDEYLKPFRARALIYQMEQINDLEKPSLIFDRHGEIIGRMFVENRSVISIEEVPAKLIDALMAQEDQRFFGHRGVDWIGVVRAVYLNLKAGEVNQGASTITMQLARNAYDLKTEASSRGESGIERKIVEAFLALRIEAYLNTQLPSEDRRRAKMQVLEYYLNRIPFGSGFYGIRSASLGYFGKEPKDLTIEECASLVACVKNPASLTPLRHPLANKKARDHVLNRMLAEDMITHADWSRMKSLPVTVNPRPLKRGTSHLYEKVAGLARLKAGTEAMSRGGFKIYTTIDRRAQEEAHEALRQQLDKVELVQGYGHPLYKDHQKTEGEAPKYLQGAALMIDSRNGEVLAYVGGRDYGHSQYDFIESGRRPLGTAFLPFIYSAALMQGWHPSTTVDDSQMDNRAVMVGGREGILGEWGMESRTPKYEGRISSRRALAASKIAASVRLGRTIGLERVVEHARTFGFDFKDAELLNRVFLGSEPASLRELVLAYTSFSQGGKVPRRLRYIERIENENQDIVYEAPRDGEKQRALDGLDEAGAYQMHSMLQDTLRTGNLAGETLRPDGEGFFGAVKTGTTNDFSDGWCVGYNGAVSLGMWVGFLEGGQGAIYEDAFGRELAYPAWARVMTLANAVLPGSELQAPDSLELVSLCERSGLLATPRYCYDPSETRDGEATFRRTVYRDWLRKDRPQVGYCDVHGQGGLSIDEVLASYGPDRGPTSDENLLAVSPIRPKAPALIGSDPYNSVVLSLAPATEDEVMIMRPPVFLLDYGVPGEEEATLRLPRPEKLEIGVD